jgi:hypothetical protein
MYADIGMRREAELLLAQAEAVGGAGTGAAGWGFGSLRGAVEGTVGGLMSRVTAAAGGSGAAAGGAGAGR